MLKLLWLIFLSAFLGCQTPTLAETGIYSGQTYGQSRCDYQATPIRSQMLFEIKKIGDFRFLLGPELITDLVSHPKDGYLAGLSPISKIVYIWDDFKVFGEFGAGATYLGLRTKEQGGPGFNFIDQVGAGIEYRLYQRFGLVAKYRYAHISHAGIRDSSNQGLDTHTGYFGLKVDF